MSGWVRPGPQPPGDLGDPELRPGADETLDALAGHWRLFQLRDGHRYSTDDLLAAWFALDTCEKLERIPARVLDLGTGIGSVGMFLLWAWSAMHLVAVERQARSLALARRSARYNGAEARVTYLEGDLRDPTLTLDRFPLVTGSPPYWAPTDGTLSTAPQKAPCRFELHGAVEDYLSRARDCLEPEGRVVLVYDGRQQDRLERAVAASGLQRDRWRPVVSREGSEPLLVLVALRLPGGAEPAAIEAPLLLRDAQGRRSAEFCRIREVMGFPPGDR